MGKIFKIIIVILLQFQTSMMFGAYLENVPIEVNQPDGTAIQLYATGDEYYNWTHDELGFTVVINPKTKYYCYATLKNGELIASSGIVGKCDPQKMELKPGINLPADKMDKIRKTAFDYMHGNEDENAVTNRNVLKDTPKTQIPFRRINNIVIFIRFADQTEFETPKNYYSAMFNSSTTASNSMYNYFKEASYGNLEINSTFYPANTGTKILSYQDIYQSGYYMTTGESGEMGYNEKDTNERQRREHALLCRAIDYVKSQIPSNLDIDNNKDDSVDNICFIIKGNVHRGILWPHKWSLRSKNKKINGKWVKNYNIQIEDRLKKSDGGVGVLCHEMNHTLGAPDLYHRDDDDDPVEKWCLMAYNLNPPQHMCAYVKYKYNGWIPEIPSITKSGSYSLNPLTSAINNCYKIAIKGSAEYLVLEYRRKIGTFESSVYGSGLVVYRINENNGGNYNGTGYGGKEDNVYVFRPNGSLYDGGDISQAFLSAQAGRESFNNGTNPYCFVSNGNYGNIYIKNIKEINGKLTFDVRFCDGTNIVKSNTSNLPEFTNASYSITTQNTVVVKNTDNVIFEAASEVTLNPGFEVKSGGAFEINMNGCGEK